MRTTQQFSITLPHELALMVKDKVSTGLYATESEVIRAESRRSRCSGRCSALLCRNKAFTATHSSSRSRRVAER